MELEVVCEETVGWDVVCEETVGWVWEGDHRVALEGGSLRNKCSSQRKKY